MSLLGVWAPGLGLQQHVPFLKLAERVSTEPWNWKYYCCCRLTRWGAVLLVCGSELRGCTLRCNRLDGVNNLIETNKCIVDTDGLVAMYIDTG